MRALVPAKAAYVALAATGKIPCDLGLQPTRDGEKILKHNCEGLVRGKHRKAHTTKRGKKTWKRERSWLAFCDSCPKLDSEDTEETAEDTAESAGDTEETGSEVLF